MTLEKKKQYFYMVIGYTGLLLIGIAAMRFLSVIKDLPGYSFAFLGLLLVMSYVRFTEEKAGVSKRVSFIGSVILAGLFFLISSFLYF